MTNQNLLSFLQIFLRYIEAIKQNFKKNDLLFLMGLLFICTGSLHAQNKTVTGKVTDGDDLEGPLAGVTILVKGTNNGTSTDFDGDFTLNNVSETATLVFSYIGYVTQEIPVNYKTTFNVTLKPSLESLDEVKIVAIGYGTVKRENLTGSVASISAKELSKVAVTNVSEALAGRLPGVSVQAIDGAPGADIIIRVRGGGSINNDNSPLYVVDGLIVDNLNDLPPGDIESIDVLKDAASTAIYGSRASNGVILVSTKRAKAGKTTVTYNTFFQVKTFPSERKYNVLSPYEFALMQYETAAIGGATTLAQFTKDYGHFGDLKLYKNMKPIDRQEDLFGKSNFSRYNNFNITGGTEATRMFLSYTSNRDSGLMPDSGQDRDALNFKLNHQISDKLKIDAGARITTNLIKGSGISGTSGLKVSNLVTNRPINGLADELIINPDSADDDYLQDYIASYLNPVEYSKQDWRQKKSLSYIFNAGLTWDILNNLKANTAVSLNKTYGENLRFYGPITGVSKENGGAPVGTKYDYEDKSYRITNTLNYSFKNLGKHDVNILIGQEVGSSGGINQSIQVGGFRPSIQPEELFANTQLGDSQYTYQSTKEETDTNIFSLFSRANYSYDDKYLFTATVRRDESSIFSKSNRVGYFPAFSAGWKISSEPFLKDSKAINQLKLRIGYGATGNDNIPTNSTNLLYFASDSRGPGFTNDLPSSYYYAGGGSTLYNPDLIWETTIGKNIGLDFTLFNSVVNGSLDFYRNEVKDLLVKGLIQGSPGFSTQWSNAGNTSNQGAELGLSMNVLNKKDYSLTINANFGTNKFRIDKLPGLDKQQFSTTNWASTDLNWYEDYLLKEGDEVGLIYGYKNDGFYTVDDFDQVTPTTYALKAGLPNPGGLYGTTLRPGSMKIKDLNNDGEIDKDNDRTVIGSTLPKATGGFGFTANLKGFDISAFFNWSYGNDEYNAGKIAYNSLFARNGGSYLNMLTTMDSSNRFTYIDIDGTYTGTPGQIITDLAQLGELNADKTIWSGNISFANRKPQLTDWAVEDASYIRFSNLTIGYTMPMKAIQNSIISNLRFYVTGTNLYLWTKYSGYDPDANNSRSNDGYQGLTPGLDFSSYPKNRSYTFGVNASF
ncbi:TonB-dependent receptor [Mariniflexile litorale]|uniref:TonB-dependent receptor n=1 Tax=Mariniflexile litorale TaxID=3045158 RepID=A0AAU7EH69_9FLAO|nr:TonB-dependent receptor [Mariniflexile sp. KMM 9835]MDQ8211714.1 TonB-dependent receptor [Mariniflexile sp. KMM 9835]